MMLSRNKIVGATLIELMISLSIGMALISALITAYYFILKMSSAQEARAIMHQEMSYLETTLRMEVPYAQFHPQCDGVLPNREAVIAGSTVTPAQLRRYKEPLLYFSSHKDDAYDLNNAKTYQHHSLQKYLDKQAPRLVFGSDALIASSLESLPWVLNKQGDLIGNHSNSIKGRRELSLYLTDCYTHLLLRVQKQANGRYQMNEADRKLVKKYLGDSRLVKIYHQRSHFVSLRNEQNDSVVVQDFLDGQSYIRTKQVARMKLWLHDFKVQQWIRAEHLEGNKWWEYDAVAFEMLFYGGESTEELVKNFELTSPLDDNYFEQLLFTNPRKEVIDIIWILKLHNI